jgi:serine/threonine protein kinase
MQDSSILEPSLSSFKNIRLSSYEIDYPIGSGAFGIVYKAHHDQTLSPVAIKVPRSELLPDPESLVRFQSEAKAGLQLEHPNIVRTLEAEFTGPIPYIVSEYCEGPDLARWLECNQAVPCSAKSVVHFAIQLANAIAYAHRQGIIHRDIKPSNVMLTCEKTENALPLEAYVPKLTDFGLAKLVIEPIVNSRSSLIIGTPMYMAPEQLLPHWGPVTFSTDIYSLGVLIVELLTGKPPRYGMSYGSILASLLGDPAKSRVASFARSIPEELERIIRQCLQRDPKDRYPTADALATDLQAFLDGKRVSAKHDRSIHRVLSWAQHPSRPIDICYFIIPLNLGFFVWMTVCTLLSTGSLYLGSDRTTDLTIFMTLAVSNNLLVAGLAALRLKGYKWTSVVALIHTVLVMVVVPILLLFGVIPNLMSVYENQPYFSSVNHTLILMFGLVQGFLLSVSIYSDIAMRQRFGRPGSSSISADEFI